VTDTTQRWKLGREYYRARAADFRPGDFGVEPILDDTTAKRFVVEHHYAGSFPAARSRAGLYRRTRAGVPELVGVAVFSEPMQRAAIPHYAPGLAPHEGVELGRLVLLDDVPYNAETWFLARAFGVMHAELPDVRIVLSYSDPVPRAAEDGRVVTPGHVGSIYQGKGARYVGRSKRRTLWLDRWGRVVSERAIGKIRNEERGWRNDARRIIDAGAPDRRLGEEPRAWLERALREGPFRQLRHPGNHAYLFDPLGTGRAIPSPRKALAYPKKDAA
jgi:hypothetical protein